MTQEEKAKTEQWRSRHITFLPEPAAELIIRETFRLRAISKRPNMEEVDREPEID